MDNAFDPIMRARLEFGVGAGFTSRDAHATLTNIVDSPPLHELVEHLAREEPESYALLAEFIELERYRDSRGTGK